MLLLMGAQSVPPSLAQQGMNNAVTCRNFVSAFHYPFLELFQQRLCIEVIFERREKWHPVMTQCKGSRVWCLALRGTSSRRKWYPNGKYLPGKQKGRKQEMLLLLNNAIFKTYILGENCQQWESCYPFQFVLTQYKSIKWALLTEHTHQHTPKVFFAFPSAVPTF